MEPIQAVILGAIQGLTEFFPVSSSGHLVVFQQLMGLKEPVLLFDISVHVGTLAAILCYYFRDIVCLIHAIFSAAVWRIRGGRGDISPEILSDSRMAWMIIAGSIPTAVIGFGLNTISDTLFSSLLLVGIALAVTGAVVLTTLWVKSEKGSDSGISFNKALLIGTVQGVAVIPGISRSGSTIAAGLFCGIDRETAARFSFLLSIPAILGALVLDAAGNGGTAGNISTSAVAMGMGTSFIVGYAALSLLVKIVQKGRLFLFAPYCFLLAAVALTVAF